MDVSPEWREFGEKKKILKYQTLDLSSNLDLRIISFNPALGSKLGTEPTLKKEKET